MKQFIVFSGDMYGQYGGMDDFTGDCDTLDEAFNLAELQIGTNVLERTEQEYYRYNWIQIYDTHAMKMVWESGEQKKVGNESVYITLREAAANAMVNENKILERKYTSKEIKQMFINLYEKFENFSCTDQYAITTLKSMIKYNVPIEIFEEEI